MNYKYGFYCSGKASRILKFYETREIELFPINYVFYDGGFLDISQKLENLFGDKLISFHNNENLKGKHLSQHVSNMLLYDMQKRKIDYLFCFGNLILKENLLNAYTNKIINFHPSILPAFPGINAIDQALASSVQFLGSTAHFVDCGIDTGLIIMQSVIKRKCYSEYEDVLTLQLTMLEKIWSLLEEDKIQVENNSVHIDIEVVDNNPNYSI